MEKNNVLQIRNQSLHFLRGFQQLIKKEWIDMFNEHEIQVLLFMYFRLKQIHFNFASKKKKSISIIEVKNTMNDSFQECNFFTNVLDAFLRNWNSKLRANVASLKQQTNSVRLSIRFKSQISFR